MWRKYEMSQKPAFVINILVPAGTFDVNISPDKREILLTNYNELLGENCYPHLHNHPRRSAEQA
jgi:DNA mismatch repair ATPase MutL